MSWQSPYIAVDWGTTNRRAWLVGPGGEVADSMADDRGLTAISPGGFPAAVAEVRARLGDAPMLLAGMVGSNRGWHEAPYVPCPAGAEDLARAILWVEPGRTGIVPGVCQRQKGGADVMRGEEVQVAGAVAAGLIAPDSLVCHPGTHAKWIAVEGGRVARFHTAMTGELFDLLQDHSVLGPQMQGRVIDGPAFRAGLDEAASGRPLLSALFGIRARHVLGEASGDGDGAAHASGLLIGHDVRGGLAFAPAGPVALVGRPDLCALYAIAIEQAGRASHLVDGSVAFLAGIAALTEYL